MSRNFLKISLSTFTLCIVSICVCSAATVSKKGESAIQSGTKVRAKVDAKGLFSEDCYNSYYGCMDQFCNPENTDGGTCACSDENTTYEKKLDDIKKLLNQANNIKTVEVEKINAGAQADIIFKGERQYDEDGNVIKVDEETKADKKKALMSLFATNEESDTEDETDLSDKKGDELYSSANELCLQQMPDSCQKDMTILTNLYSNQIKSDCKAFANIVEDKQNAADTELASAKAEVRSALKESFDAANKFDRGTCMVEFKKCMLTEDACGKDWTNCVSTIASENMQNQTAVSTAGTKVETTVKYDITDSTMEILGSKRNICEKVLNQCMAVRDMVWPDFLREAAPTIKVAELNAESKLRQSCLTDISSCIQKACKDDIVGKGKDTMDSCLSRPDMARSFCKVQIDSCERMEPMIWGYVTDKLAAMRVDACTSEVKECFTSEDRCGTDFNKCMGMDFNYIHNICPIDKLVVCKANNPKFAMEDLDSMLMGLYLNIDNSALENCQKKVDEKMTEICGSTTDCNKFAADDTLGAGSLNYQKAGNVYNITGMISYGLLKVGNGADKIVNADGKKVVLGAGEVDVTEYMNKLSSMGVPAGYESVVESIRFEVENVQGTINRTVDMIEKDPEIQFCINGRDLSQITGEKGAKTSGRFPNLLTQVKMQIAIAAVHKAQENYNKKYNEYIAKASKESSTDLANLMCNKLPASNGVGSGISNAELDDTGLSRPYAIAIQIGGISNASIAAGGTHSSGAIGGKAIFDTDNTTKSSSTVSTVSALVSVVNPTAIIADVALKLGSDKRHVEFDGGTRDMWSMFNRETRNCHYCTSTITKNCKTKGSRGFLGLWDSRGVQCDVSPPVEKCEDIPM